MRHFQETMISESLQTPQFQNPETIEYQRLQQRFTRAMDAEAQHGPVRVLVANGRKLWE